MKQKDDAASIIGVLNAHEVRYLVIGGIAGTLFGSPYPTDDLDICPDRREANLKRLALALTELEAKEWDPRKDTFSDRGWDEETLTLDETWLLDTKFGKLGLVFSPTGTGGFPDLRRRHVAIEVAGHSVPVSGLEDLIRMKEAAGRERDLLQVPTLRKLLEEWKPDTNR